MKKGGRTVPRSPNRYATPLGRKTPAERSFDQAKAGEFSSRPTLSGPKPHVKGKAGLGPPLYDIERGPLPRIVPKKS